MVKYFAISVATLLSTVLSVATSVGSDYSDAAVRQGVADFWEATVYLHDYDVHYAAASFFVQAGKSRNDKWLRARGLCRQAFTDLMHGRWKTRFKLKVEEAKILTENPDSLDQILARGEVLMYSGFIEGMWIHRPKTAREELEQSTSLAWKTGDDVFLAGVYRMMFAFERNYGPRTGCLSYALLAKHYADRSQLHALQDVARANLLVTYDQIADQRDSEACQALARDVIDHWPVSSLARKYALRVLPQASPPVTEEFCEAFMARCQNLADEEMDGRQRETFSFDYRRFLSFRLNEAVDDDLLEVTNAVLDYSKGVGDKQAVRSAKRHHIDVLFRVGRFDEALGMAEGLYEDSINFKALRSANSLAQRVAVESAQRGDAKRTEEWRQRASDAFVRQQDEFIPLATRSADFMLTLENETRLARSNERETQRERNRWRVASFGALLLGVFAVAVIRSRALQIKQTELTKQVELKTRELELARNEALNSNRAKGEFLAWMNHELRNPLSAVSVSSELLTFPNVQKKERDECVNTILAGTRHLTELVETILDFSRIDSGAIEVNKTHVHLASVIHDVAKVIEQSAARKKLEIRTVITTPEDTVVYTDKAKLRQILINLGNNAVAHTDRGYVRIEVGLSPLEPQGEGSATSTLTLSVTDTGRGVSSEAQEKLFSAFATGNEEIDAKKGTGLGLYICSALAKRLGGTIHCNSEEGVGSEFYVQFPVELSHRSDVPQKDKIEHRQTIDIVLIDDNPFVLHSHSSLLNLSGFRCLTASNWTDAMDLLQCESPAAVVTDLKMPEKDGYAVLAHIRATTDSGRSPKVIAFTGNADSRTRDLALQAGFDGFITKPMSDEQVNELTRIIQGEKSSTSSA